MIALNSYFKNKEYFRVGYQIGEYLHSIKYKIYKSDVKILQDLMSGLFKAYGLFGPITVVKCFDETTAHKVL